MNHDVPSGLLLAQLATRWRHLHELTTTVNKTELRNSSMTTITRSDQDLSVLTVITAVWIRDKRGRFREMTKQRDRMKMQSSS